MVTPNFKKATNAVIDPTDVKYGAPDVRKIADVLDGTHATERVQVENIERVTNPWTYFIYQENSITYARRGDTFRAEFSDSANPRTPIQNAIDTAYAVYGKAVIYLAPQQFTAPIPTNSNPPVDGSTSGLIALGTQGGRTLKNNISIIGAGIDRTILQNFAIQKETTALSENITIQDLTIDAGAIGTLNKSLDSASQPAANDTQGYGTALSISSYSKNFKILRVKAQNSRDFCLHYGGQIGSMIENSIFIDGGLGHSRDTAAGGGAYYTDPTEVIRNQDWLIIRNNTFVKNLSRGGGMMTTGRTGKLLIIGNQFFNYDTTSYQGISIENDQDYGPNDETRIMFNKGYGPRQGCQVGNNSTATDWQGDRAIIHGNIFEGPLAVKKIKEAIISDNIVQNSRGAGIVMAQCERGICHHNYIRNTNVGSPNASGASSPGVYINDCGYVSLDHIMVVDDADENSTNPRLNTALNPTIALGTITTPAGILVSGRGSTGGGIVNIDNCTLLGDIRASPASPFWAVLTDTTSTGEALRVHSTQEVIIRGGRIKGPTTHIFGTGGSVNGTIDCRGLVGYNPVGPASITVPGTGPFTYTNNDGVCEMVHIFGGTVSNVSRSGTQIANSTNVHTWLDPGQSIVVTYSSAPTMVKDRK